MLPDLELVCSADQLTFWFQINVGLFSVCVCWPGFALGTLIVKTHSVIVTRLLLCYSGNVAQRGQPSWSHSRLYSHLGLESSGSKTFFILCTGADKDAVSF